KPQANDPNVQYTKIPNTHLALCLWPGGMEQYSQCCFDFFDLFSHVPVDAPEGFKIMHLPQPSMFPYKGRLPSWEESMRAPRTQDGLEKYSAPEGMKLMLTYPRNDSLYFQIPSRPAMGFSQAQPGVPPI
ncbi:hypothetical protein OG21DRAFT_1422293, partial [Imleria badia]